jgi:hypothetical protein
MKNIKYFSNISKLFILFLTLKIIQLHHENELNNIKQYQTISNNIQQYQTRKTISKIILILKNLLKDNNFKFTNDTNDS